MTLPYDQPMVEPSSRMMPSGATVPLMPRGATRTARPTRPPATPTTWIRSMRSPIRRRMTSTTSGMTPTMSAVRPDGTSRSPSITPPLPMPSSSDADEQRPKQLCWRVMRSTPGPCRMTRMTPMIAAEMPKRMPSVSSGGIDLDHDPDAQIGGAPDHVDDEQRAPDLPGRCVSESGSEPRAGRLGRGTGRGTGADALARARRHRGRRHGRCGLAHADQGAIGMS